MFDKARGLIPSYKACAVVRGRIRFASRWSFVAITIACAPALISIACTVGANVGDLGGTAADGATAEGGTSADAGDAATPGGDDGSSSSDGSKLDTNAPPIDAGCGVTFGHAATAAWIDVQIINGPTPNLSGGTIVQGTYALTAMRVYFGGQTGTMKIRETIRIRGSSSDGTFDVLTEAQNATGTFNGYPLHGETINFTVAGSTPGLFTTPECPKKDFQVNGRFDVKGDVLTWLDDERVIERVYTRVP